MAELSATERFYGVHLADEVVVAAAGEQLTDRDAEDLVAAHLQANYSYFGAIDKTLAGFVVLDDEGDNYTLFDARGPGTVWWQDHETRDVSPLFDTLQGWLDRGGATDRDPGAGVAATEDDPAPGNPATEDDPATGNDPAGQATEPSSAVLLDRYQWLVWLLAQPMRDRDGRVLQTDRELAAGAAGRLRHVWPTDAAATDTLATELPLLARDPHLALYWLLHTAVLGWQTPLQQVREALDAAAQPELVRAFLAAFGNLERSGDVPVVPGFRTRRALLLLDSATDRASIPAAALAALGIAPEASPMLVAYAVADGLADGRLDDATVVEGLDGIPDSVGVHALRAVLDRRAGAGHSPHADAFAATFDPAVPGPARGGVPAPSWEFAGTLLQQVHQLVGDPVALIGAARFLFDHDPYRPDTLDVVIRARELAARSGTEAAGLPDTALLHRYRDLGESAGTVFRELLERPEAEAELLAGLSDRDVARSLALRMLYRADAVRERVGLLRWAAGTALAGPAVAELDGRAVLETVAAALTEVRSAALAELVPALVDLPAADGAEQGPGVRLLLRVLDRPVPQDLDLNTEFAVRQLNERCLRAIAPHAPEPDVFDALLSLAERPADHLVLVPLWQEVLAPKTPEMAGLSDTQAQRMARALVTDALEHPSIHARNAAHDRLRTFTHPGALEYLVEALATYGDRYAASEPKGGTRLDHGETEDDVLEHLVYALYGALARSADPRARAALMERLFTERRAFWWMADTLGGLLGGEPAGTSSAARAGDTGGTAPGVHAQVLAALRERHDGFAAGSYAYTLADFTDGDQRAVELLGVLVDWPVPGQVVPRRFFRYALHVGMAAALRLHEHDLVRAAHVLAVSIAEPALQPDDHARPRGNRWQDPLEDELRDRLTAVLSGAADTRRDGLRATGSAARTAGQPLRRITDDELGLLAEVTVQRRLLHEEQTGQIWFLDTEDGVHVFDGYDIVPAPFTSRRIGHHEMGAFLTGVTELSARAAFWTADAGQFVELVRYGDRIVLSEGVNNGRLTRTGLVFADAGAAAAAFARLGDQQGRSGLTGPDPWYVPGHGAVVRTYYIPEPDGSYSHERHGLMVLGDRFHYGNRDVAAPAGAVAAHEDWVLTAERDRNASLVTIEWMDQ